MTQQPNAPVAMILARVVSKDGMDLLGKITGALNPVLWPGGQPVYQSYVLVEATLASAALLMAHYADTGNSPALLRHGAVYFQHLANGIEAIEDASPAPAPALEPECRK